MAATTKIEWCDFTFNPWRGCQKVAPGCKHCYAETRSNRFGEDFAGQRIRLSDAGWREPLNWNQAGAEYEAATGKRLRVFCASLADVFEDWRGSIVNHNGKPLILCPDCGVQRNRWEGPLLFRENRWFVNCPECEREYGCCGGVEPLRMNDLRRDLFALIDKTPYLDWLILTKRPENIRRMWPACPGDTNGDGDCSRRCLKAGHRFRKNVWLLTSVSEQKSADRNIPMLLKCRDLVPVLGVSAEPLLGAIELDTWLKVCKHWKSKDSLQAAPWHPPYPKHWYERQAIVLAGCKCHIDWIIAGGESGPQARPCDLAWIQSIRDQCAAAQMPLFVKQWGSNPVACDDEFGWMTKDDIGLKHPKGGDMEEWGEDICVRQFPVTSNQTEANDG